MSNWEKIQKEWEITKITLAALAEKHDVKLGTLKSRKSREAWVRGPSEKDATISKRMQPKEAIVESDDLTDKQRLFCIYYIKYFNATKAYQKAYECDYMTAQSIAYRVMGNDGVKAEIRRLKEHRLNEAYFDKYDVLQKYKDIAFADIGDYVKSDDGYLVSLKSLEEVDTSIVSEISNTENGPKLKLADKMKALEMLAKFTDLLSDNDKKRLQEEKLKVDITRTKAEIEKLSGGNDEGPIEIIIKRREKTKG
ncbi:terminase small subunit [Sporosarcina sp. resist]|uniref:terminase small subunit n=1 Tax=Sporosarcina sp. resist TaxID=2762563 RepID=UPI00164E9D03|nr:terminase small subunit [Sporosarcina sp. resist]QNK86290.1 terminase small subunit [Sporosarcina sp. resist]